MHKFCRQLHDNSPQKPGIKQRRRRISKTVTNDVWNECLEWNEMFQRQENEFSSWHDSLFVPRTVSSSWSSFLFYHKYNIHSISDILFLVPVTRGSNTFMIRREKVGVWGRVDNRKHPFVYNLVITWSLLTESTDTWEHKQTEDKTWDTSSSNMAVTLQNALDNTMSPTKLSTDRYIMELPSSSLFLPHDSLMAGWTRNASWSDRRRLRQYFRVRKSDRKSWIL